MLSFEFILCGGSKRLTSRIQNPTIPIINAF